MQANVIGKVFALGISSLQISGACGLLFHSMHIHATSTDSNTFHLGLLHLGARSCDLREILLVLFSFSPSSSGVNGFEERFLPTHMSALASNA